MGGFINTWLADMPLDMRDVVHSKIADAAAASEQWWGDLSASAPQAEQTEDPEEVPVAHVGGGLVAEVGAEDEEHPAAQKNLPAFLLQRRLADLVDRRIGDALAHSLGEAGRWPDVRRLQEVSDPGCNHEWLWQSSPDVGLAFTPVEYVTAVRLRLGAAGPDEPAVCGRCGVSLLDACAAHALCCANAVVGHNDVRDELHAAASTCDPSAELEPLGLISSHPTLRLADILTSAALPGRLAALDVGVASPDAAGAGADCTISM